ncbi:hypothetical protein DVI67_22680 [Escherichia coli]|nr:hypothetical protein [Escherichia coli]
MTQSVIRGYIPHAPAKSGVGIGVLDRDRDRYTPRACFLLSYARASELWRAVWGSRKARRFPYPVVLTPHSSPPR